MKIKPESDIANIVLLFLFFYLFVRHFIFTLMIMDLLFDWVRQFRWFPGPGRRADALKHWGIAMGLFFGFLIFGAVVGWFKFLPA